MLVDSVGRPLLGGLACPLPSTSNVYHRTPWFSRPSLLSGPTWGQILLRTVMCQIKSHVVVAILVAMATYGDAQAIEMELVGVSNDKSGFVLPILESPSFLGA